MTETTPDSGQVTVVQTKPKISKKPIFVVVIVLVVIVAAGVTGMLIHQHQNNTKKVAAKTAASAAAAKLKTEPVYIQQAAQKATSSNATAQDKADAYSQLASYQLSANDPKDALQSALQYDGIKHSATSSAFVASIYDVLGNKSQAASYYKKAASEVDPNRINGPDANYYTNLAQKEQ